MHLFQCHAFNSRVSYYVSYIYDLVFMEDKCAISWDYWNMVKMCASSNMFPWTWRFLMALFHSAILGRRYLVKFVGILNFYFSLKPKISTLDSLIIFINIDAEISIKFPPQKKLNNYKNIDICLSTKVARPLQKKSFHFPSWNQYLIFQFDKLRFKKTTWYFSQGKFLHFPPSSYIFFLIFPRSHWNLQLNFSLFGLCKSF